MCKQKIVVLRNKHKKLFEIVRFLIVGGFATVVDMFVMGIVIYCFQPTVYTNFFDVFFKSNNSPSLVSTVVGTGVGFLAGLIFNYILSVIFVYEESGSSKTIKGFTLFAFLSAIGLLIHIAGMYLLYSVCGINEWIVKCVLTVIVLIYNYLTRKIFIFRSIETKDGNQ